MECTILLPSGFTDANDNLIPTNEIKNFGLVAYDW